MISPAPAPHWSPTVTPPYPRQADRLFSSGGNPEDSFSFNESRLSLGMGRLSIDGMRVVSRPSIGQSMDTGTHAACFFVRLEKFSTCFKL